MGLKKETVEFKGTRKGLTVFCDDKAIWDDLLGILKERLEGKEGAFFTGASVTINLGMRSLNTQQVSALWQVFESNGLIIKSLLMAETGKSIHNRMDYTVKKDNEENVKGDALSKLPTLVVTRNLRSGQDITFPGNIIIFGDVKPGSKITVSGFILVLGSLMGTVHAGAEGNEKAWVAAQQLQPTQLRIAGYITRAPDEKPVEPEIARIYDGAVVVSEWKDNKREY